MGTVIRAYRHHPYHGRRPLPQAEVAQWLGITQGQLSRIEAGRNRVRDLDKLARYARDLHIPRDLLWFRMDDDRGVAPTQDMSRPLDVVAEAAGTESTLADALLATLDQYAITENLAGPGWLLPISEHQARFAEQALLGCRGQRRTKLSYVSARFAEFTGWLNQDLGDWSAAMRWSNTALDFAHDARDDRLISYIRMRKSSIASDAGRPDLAIACATQALREPGVLTPRLQAVALRAEAFGHALLGNGTECSRALDLARQSAGESDAFGPDIAEYCTLNYVEMEAGNCWIELGEPAKAIEVLQGSLIDWPPRFRRDRGLCLARLADAHARVAEPDEAIRIADHSLVIAVETSSHRTLRKLSQAAEALAVHAPEHARHLCDAIRTAARRSRSVGR